MPDGLTTGAWLIIFLVVQRFAEVAVAKWNSVRLLDAGAREFGASHYHLIIALHAFWLLGLWMFGHDRNVNPVGFGLFMLLQGARLWVLFSLGRRWTTRVIVIPGAPKVTRGPYRWLRHPNYWVVACEIALVPLTLGLPVFALVFSVANAALLLLRIRVEDKALAWATSVASGQHLPMSLQNDS